MNVDEARRDRAIRGVDRSRGRDIMLSKLSDGRNSVAANADVGRVTRVAAAVDDGAAANDEIEEHAISFLAGFPTRGDAGVVGLGRKELLAAAQVAKVKLIDESLAQLAERERRRCCASSATCTAAIFSARRSTSSPP